ncbi:glucose-6-phosphate isomerase [Actinomadura viridis]|uniref:Glucose-6-phosphate isomerase n=1 Tax=Actinomadura viridis TaxID=58110 RepID=A0A931GP18_9ACTN|nr:glucose-6-phosphate isomerase [Actinomadura viridis]MBG6090126.1 glucose-6-phosphate isomerase [Actinomadura viridis]
MTSVVTAGGISVTMRGAVVDQGAAVLERLVSDGVPARLASGASGLWGPDAAPAAARGMGWLELPGRSRALPGRLAGLAGEARGAGLDRVVLAGTGGGVLAPEVITRAAGVEPVLLDGTDPHQIGSVIGDARLSRTLLVVTAGPDGIPAETDAHLRIFEDAFRRAGITGAGLRRRFLVVAPEGSPAAALAAEAGYRLVPAEPDVPPRFGALGAYGLVPSTLAGADVGRLLEEAAALAPTLGQPYDNPALALGAALGASAQAGRGKLVIAGHGAGLAGFGDWLEHLVSESTGKDGKGLLPVVVEGVDAPGYAPAADTCRVLLDDGHGEPGRGRDADVTVTGPLGAQFLLWEYATAVACRVIGVDPFSRPDAAESDDNAAALLRAEEGASPTVVGRPALVSGAVEVHGPEKLLKGTRTLTSALEAIVAAVPERGYLAVSAYLDRWGDPDAGGLRSLLADRAAGGRRRAVPVTFGWGSRALRSTGQYHKGGPGNGAFLQLTGEVVADVPVPGRPYTLGHLQLAQAFGDLRVLRSRGCPAVRLHLRDRVDGLAQLTKALTS